MSEIADTLFDISRPVAKRSPIILRPYQLDAVEATFQAWADGAKAVLGVAATGLGKTVLFASIAAQHEGNVLVVAHREELIFQAAKSIQRITGEAVEIEMADLRAEGKARIVVSTIQTQTAGGKGGRMQGFDPRRYSLLVCDESHHVPAASWLRMIDYYRHDGLHILGVTATPDRADEKALGKVFDTVGWEYDVRYGIDEGWLVPITQQMVYVGEMDLSNCKTTAGDLNGADLARVMEYEQVLHGIASPTIELTSDGRKTLIFAASVAHAERLAEILNRHRRDCARSISGQTPSIERRQIISDYASGRFQYLVNCAIATEGFDDPSIAVVVQARPTKSRAVYAQQIGRGTRPLPGVVDDPDMFGSADMRREAIASSRKPGLTVIDFVGNSGRHKLISTADILGGNYDDAVIAKAKEKAAKEPRDMSEALEEAAAELQRERERQAAERARLVMRAEYTVRSSDPFDVFHLSPWRERGWDSGKAITPKMAGLLERQGISTKDMPYSKAKQLVAEIMRRWDKGLCTYKQARVLGKRGYDTTNMTMNQAKAALDEIAAKEGWKR